MHAGRSYALARSETKGGVVTDEYLLAGEKAEAWSCLVTVQRLAPRAGVRAVDLVEYLRGRTGPGGWAGFECDAAGSRACVFMGRTAAVGAVPGLRIVGLVITEPPPDSGLSVVHFSIREGAPDAEGQGAAWRERFLRQAASLNGAPSQAATEDGDGR